MKFYVPNEDGRHRIHTNGIGIANGSNVEVGPTVALMRKTPNLKLIKSNCRVLHLLLQIRFCPNGYAVKGTVLVNKKLPSRSIQVRDPIIKVRSDSNP
ncbi:hypothetical protein GQ457_11G024260 [Hibiscus cannabinus]